MMRFLSSEGWNENMVWLPDPDCVARPPQSCLGVMFAIAAFGYLFGFVGLPIAVPLAAAIGVVSRFAMRQYLVSQLEPDGRCWCAGTFGQKDRLLATLARENLIFHAVLGLVSALPPIMHNVHHCYRNQYSGYQ